MVSGERLAEPRKAREPSVPSNLRRHIPSEAQLARSQLMLRARDARSVTPPKLTAYNLSIKVLLDDFLLGYGFEVAAHGMSVIVKNNDSRA